MPKEIFVKTRNYLRKEILTSLFIVVKKQMKKRW